MRQLVAVPKLYVHILATLCRFDDKHEGEPLLGPFIPSQRRLANMELLGIQGRAFLASFRDREYGRPHEHIMVTLRNMD